MKHLTWHDCTAAWRRPFPIRLDVQNQFATTYAQIYFNEENARLKSARARFSEKGGSSHWEM
jgi:hypothetical protein